MLKYLAKRIFYIAFVLVLVSILIFTIFRSMPHDPVDMMMEGRAADMSPERFFEERERIRQMLRLDDPIVIQYFVWMGNMLTGNLGHSSFWRQPVAQLVRAPMAATIRLNVLTLIFVFLITIPVGIRSAIKRGSLFDNGALFFTLIGFSFPGFLFALLMMLIFAVWLQILPMSGMGSPIPPEGAWAFFLDRARFMILPLITMVLSGMAGMVRFTRAAMIDSITQDYVRTARSKGLGEKVVIYSHAFRNALIPIITVMTSWFIGIFGGSVVIERLFSYNGMGDIMLTALVNMDFAVVMTMSVFYALIAFVGLLLMDIAYVVADPRIRLE